MPIVLDGYRPGALGGVLGLHMDYYAAGWGFGQAFETKVAAELAAFLARMDPAHLRWFVVAGSERGSGLGKQLMTRAMDHADRVAAGPVWLTTFAGLEAARALYERHGFALSSENDDDQWRGGVREQLFRRPAPFGASLESSHS